MSMTITINDGESNKSSDDESKYAGTLNGTDSQLKLPG